MLLFSVNPAFDLMPPSENLDDYFAEQYDASLAGMDPERAELYKVCEQQDVGITVMKGYAGGRLFNEKTSPFGVAFTPVQCIHYALTRPAVASIMAGYSEPRHVADAVATFGLWELNPICFMIPVFFNSCTYSIKGLP